MIRLCPFCGHTLSRKLKCGITTCDNCCRVFDSSFYHQTLSAAWLVRNWHVYDAYMLELKFEIPKEVVEPVEKYIIDQDMSHSEFTKIMDEMIVVDQSA